jgi:integrase
VVPGDDPEHPRHDLKRPWDAVTKRAGLIGVRLHDLRHTYASFGAGGGLGLPIIGRLLGHAQAATTARGEQRRPFIQSPALIASALC